MIILFPQVTENAKNFISIQDMRVISGPDHYLHADTLLKNIGTVYDCITRGKPGKKSALFKSPQERKSKIKPYADVSGAWQQDRWLHHPSRQFKSAQLKQTKDFFMTLSEELN